LTEKLRASTIPQLANKSFGKIVHIGHSFGSILSYSLVEEDPTISDGVILTGFTQYPNFLPYFLVGSAFVQANTLGPLSDYADGYFAPAVESSLQINFFAPGAFDHEILEVAYETGQPVTVGELLTLGTNSGNPNSFAGPVLVITGGMFGARPLLKWRLTWFADRDLPFCGGDCSNTGNPCLGSFLDVSAGLLKNATPFESYVVPGAGHGLALVSAETPSEIE
jgi:pimeloyl-ACP methyl ester carboxylesterase